MIHALVMAGLLAGFVDAEFGGPAAPRCWARAYDAAHLSSHPRQRLVSVTLARAPDAPEPGALRYAFRVKGDPARYGGLAVCADAGRRAHCRVEGDGGDFWLTRSGQGLRLEVGERWSSEGERGFVDLGSGGDDRIVLLRQAPCPPPG